MGDRTMARGDADLKIGRAIWVVFSWFAGGLLALIAGAAVAWVLLKASIIGLVLCLGANIALRAFVRLRADRHEKQYHPQTPLELAAEAKD